MLSHIFDTHSHYDAERFEGGAEALIRELFAQNLSGIVHAATDPASAAFGLEMSRKFPRFYTSAGLHPEYASDFDLRDVEALREVAKASEKVVAIGEIGLDYHYEGFDRVRQTELFRAQIELAKELDLPVIVHSRDATADCMEILKELKPRGVMHCFSGSWETAKEVLNLGMYLGFTGVLTFKNAKKSREVVEKMPLDRLLLETDCPYMAPEPHRGECCHSGLIRFTAQVAADVRGVDYEELVEATEKNAREMYGLEV